MEEVPPVVRGEFVYRDTLFVDVGEGKRHTRAPESEIKNLLTGKASKDQVGHWYEAQLIHYGLPRSKVKDTAKVRLQQALNQGKLAVPPHIVDMEGQMKKEYVAAARKAKKGASSSQPSTTLGKKRKNEEIAAESSKKTKITMTVNGIAIDIEHGQESSKAASKASQTSEKKNSSAGSSGAAPKEKQKPKTKVSDATSNPPKNTKSKPDTGERGSVPGVQPSDKAKAATKSEPRAKSEAKVKAEPKAKSEAKVSKAKAEPKVKAELKVKAETKVKKEPTLERPSPAKKTNKVHVKAEPDVDDEQPGPRPVTGVYNLTCTQLAEQLPDYANNFRLFLCVDENQIWGGFELEKKSGVLKIDKIRLDETVTFGWRARDNWENDRLQFGRGCFGEIELVEEYGRVGVKGVFYNLFDEPMVFEGSRRPGPLWCGRSAYSFQQEWDGFVARAYSR